MTATKNLVIYQKNTNSIGKITVAVSLALENKSSIIKENINKEGNGNGTIRARNSATKNTGWS
jgi:hypothetical protein